MKTKPTHKWLVGNRLYRLLGWAFIAVTLAWFVTLWSIRYAIIRDCTDPYRRDIRVAGYWIHVEAGSTKLECPQP